MRVLRLFAVIRVGAVAYITQNLLQNREVGEQTAQACAKAWFRQLITSVDVTCRPGRLGISRIGLSFETRQQHSSFRPTSAQLV
jgi:hypothetical protein